MDSSRPTMNIALAPQAHKAPGEAPAGAPASAAARMVPKPVEVHSVPETPVNTASPANGTPRPELDLSMREDDADKAKREDEGVIERLATPPASGASTADESTTDEAAGDEGSGSMQPAMEKRKLEDEPQEEGEEAAGEQEERERAEKKAKNGDGQVKGKPGRPRKDKSAPPAVGKAARKTRSQGPAEA